MTKAQIHFSNKIDALIEVLKASLFPKGAGLFDRRLIAVPNAALKGRIFAAFAEDPDLRVAAGMRIVSTDRAYTCLTAESLPSTLELSLFLQHELLGMIGTCEALRTYFKAPSKEGRVGPLCDLLAGYFLEYKAYGKPELPSWQEELYRRLPWVFPADYPQVVDATGVHLFGYTHMSPSVFSLFAKAGATFYFFSPCTIFWGDFFSDKEQAAIQKAVGSEQRAPFDEMSEDQNPLLANWGKVGRRLHVMVEDTHIPTWEHYVVRAESSCALHQLQQAMLEGARCRPDADSSLQIASAASRLREVEALKDRLLHLFVQKGVAPRDVQVYAPDINPYLPFIEAVFDGIDVAFEGVDLRLIDPMRGAFDRLLTLPESRFALEDVLELLPHLLGEFDREQVGRWAKAAGIRWGFSKESRRTDYMRELEGADIHALSERGTWMSGLRRLILGLGDVGGEALPIVGITEMEAFDRLYTLVCDLAGDLSPLVDGTKWTIPTWLRYLACLMRSYLPIDSSHKWYRRLLELASSCDHLDRETVPYEGVTRVAQRCQSGSHAPAHLQVVRFSSLTEGCLLPSKVVAFIGLEEGAFPRREAGDSLYFGTADGRLRRADLDRYHLLQGLLSAGQLFYLSYVRDPEDAEGPPLLVQQLLAEIEGGQILHHPAHAHDPRYFGGDLPSYNRHAYALLQAERRPKRSSVLIPAFYAPTPLKKVKLEDISLSALAQFARHPLRYHLSEILGIYPHFSGPDRRDYLLDFSTRRTLVMERLAGKEIEDRLPFNLFNPLARKQIEEEVDKWRGAMGGASFAPQTISLAIGPYRIKGRIDTALPHRWLFRGKDTLEDRIRYLPQLLLARELGVEITFIGDGSSPAVEGTLEAYLDYFARSQVHPSPLLPKLARGFLSNDLDAMQGVLKQLDDPVWTYLLLRDPPPTAEILLENWQSYLQPVLWSAGGNV